MKILKIFFVLLLVFFHTNLKAYSADPKEFVFELVSEVIEKLSSKNLDKKEK